MASLSTGPQYGFDVLILFYGVLDKGFMQAVTTTVKMGGYTCAPPRADPGSNDSGRLKVTRLLVPIVSDVFLAHAESGWLKDELVGLKERVEKLRLQVLPIFLRKTRGACQEEAGETVKWVTSFENFVECAGANEQGPRLKEVEGWLTKFLFCPMSVKSEPVPRNGYDIFISYAGPDKLFALALHQALKQENYQVFVDELCIPKGSTASLQMIEAACNSQLGIVLLSEEFFCRKWPQFELGIFQKRAQLNLASVIPIFLAITCDEADKVKRTPFPNKFPQSLLERLAATISKYEESIEGIFKDVVDVIDSTAGILVQERWSAGLGVAIKDIVQEVSASVGPPRDQDD